jgi:hypothetical protein
MYSSKTDIKEVLLENFEQLANSRDEEQAVAEIADRFVPVEYGAIMKDWIQLPEEHSDKWKELGYDANRNEGGILRLMQMDLIFYYLETTQDLWVELKKERVNA